MGRSQNNPEFIKKEPCLTNTIYHISLKKNWPAEQQAACYSLRVSPKNFHDSAPNLISPCLLPLAVVPRITTVKSAAPSILSTSTTHCATASSAPAPLTSLSKTLRTRVTSSASRNLGWSIGFHKNFLHLDRRVDYTELKQTVFGYLVILSAHFVQFLI